MRSAVFMESKIPTRQSLRGNYKIQAQFHIGSGRRKSRGEVGGGGGFFLELRVGVVTVVVFYVVTTATSTMILIRIAIWEFPKIVVPYFGVLFKRILLFRVLY